MPHAPLQSASTDGSADAPAPVVHLTRRARIEAERSAGGGKGVARDHTVRATAPRSVRPASRPSTADLASPVTPAAPASPIDLAPASPAMPPSSAGPVTPPAPSSPVVGLPSAHRVA
ncbi:hypothetical protein J7E22_12570, partial [Curtobacterium sp. ISL-83]|nr:hypothetical protein [Curtobacterium sp. ISL-83]